LAGGHFIGKQNATLRNKNKMLNAVIESEGILDSVKWLPRQKYRIEKLQNHSWCCQTQTHCSY